jgi:ABC-type sugar transport system substrate-binding protein
LLAGGVAAGMLVMTFTTVGTAGATATPKAATPKATRSLVYFIFTGYTPPYFAPMAAGITDAAKKYPSLNIKTLSANGSDSAEVSDIKEAVAAGAKGIILNPIDNSVTSAAQQAMKAGVPVVTIDRDVASASGRIAFIGDKDVTLGHEQTSYGLSWLAKQGFKKPWNVVILQGTLGSSTAIDRLAGAKDALKADIANKSVKVVLSQSANFDTATAQTLMTEELAKTTNIQLVIAGNDAMALGAITAFKTHGITPGKTVGIVGADAQPESLTAIKAGTQLDTVTHSPYVEAFWAVGTLSKYFTSHKKPANPNIVIPMTVVTKANVSKVTGWGTPKTVPALP